jgi:uncharacterized protein YneR
MAENDATQPDATEKEIEHGFKEESKEAQEEFTEEFPEEELSPRQKAIEELVVRRNEEFNEEMAEDVSSEEVEDDIPDEIRVETKKDDSSPMWKEDDSWYTTIKIDGEDIKVPFNDLKSSHQKDKASQKRFEDAAEYGRRVQEREAQLNAYVQNMQQQQQKQKTLPSQDAEPEQEQPDDSPDLIKKYHEALYEDDADKAAELFKALTNKGRGQPATQNVDEAVQQALQRAMAQQQAQNKRQQQYAYQKSLEDAVKWFDSEFPDVAGTPELRAVADNRTIELTQSNPDWSPKQIMQEAAESTRQWAKEFLSPNKNERVARKQKIVQHPKATNASARLGEEEPVPETAADIINEMKRVRGQVIQ